MDEMTTTWIQQSAALFTSRRCRVEHGRLVYYYKEADAAFWDSQWKQMLSQSYYRRYLAGDLEGFERPFTRHLPKEGRILEAGCGVARFVVALRARGYDCVGADFAEETITAVRAILPDLPVVATDVTHMNDVSDGEFAGVVSLGVVEHREAGPEPFLDETWRILSPGGMLLISVPTFNGLRRWRERHGKYNGDVRGMEFYQYAFPPEEFRGYLARAGFRTIAEYPYDPRTGLGEDLPVMRHVARLEVLARVVYRCSRYLPRPLHEFVSHMRLYIAQKIERPSPL